MKASPALLISCLPQWIRNILETKFVDDIKKKYFQESQAVSCFGLTELRMKMN